MADKISAERRSENMRRIRSKDMKPEMVVRKLIHGMGYRYRLHRKDLPGKPDLVFTPRKKVIFVHGCFWHQHNADHCPITRKPKSNGSYWLPKLEKNVKRDQRNLEELEKLEWDFLVIWECEIKDTDKLKKKIKIFFS